MDQTTDPATSNTAARLEAMSKSAFQAACKAERQGDRKEAIRQVEKSVSCEKLAKHAKRLGR